ncbi:cytidylate kinase [Actinobaculum suis]|uniref:(d)CMP kinase n=1 Tax=Actinobaculum suis TaxID=1657 RepID=UPI00066FD020|nr:(d)CMP kinase [Actinobaculum suis]KMY23759.1 cytidylate kinase [Actinobaculum suis]
MKSADNTETAASNPPVVIAIDGPSGAGKSTAAKAVARRLGIGYLDTGAMYRAATWWVLHKNISLTPGEIDDAAVTAAVREMDLQMPLDPDQQTIRLAGEDITQAIRSSEIARKVSALSTNLEVRDILVARQKAIIAGARPGIVAEGRDITTVVAPEAQVRILLTASAQARLARRAAQTRGKVDAQALAQTRQEVVGRDEKDSTVVNFTDPEPGVELLDTSDLNIEQVVDKIMALVPLDGLVPLEETDTKYAERAAAQQTHKVQ